MIICPSQSSLVAQMATFIILSFLFAPSTTLADNPVSDILEIYRYLRAPCVAVLETSLQGKREGKYWQEVDTVRNQIDRGWHSF